MSLEGKAELVTGSTSGIGLAVAQAFAAEGCSVMLNGLGDRDAIDALRDGIARKAGVKVAYNAADMSKPAEIADLVADTQAKLGGIDILVNNAGIQHVARVENFPPDKWDAIIASTHGLVASSHKVAYVAAKHGLIGLTKVMGIECADTGVTCNAICPGFVSTPLALAQIEVRAKADKLSVEQASRLLIAEKQPQVQFNTAEQIAGFAVFLASNTASNMQGTALVSDGGWTAQ